MCTTLPEVLVTVMGIEKVLPEWRDLEVFLQLLPRSSTAERMNPYTSLWTGVREGDGPREFHLVLLDNGRTDVLADEVGRQALHCIRCSACLNVCPVYSRTGGQAYESVYPGPIGAILTPQLEGLDRAPTLPWASSLCGACYEVCPVKIDIPSVLIHLRGRVVREAEAPRPTPSSSRWARWGRCSPRQQRYERAQRLARRGRGPLAKLPIREAALSGWTAMRDLPEIPEQTLPGLVAGGAGRDASAARDDVARPHPRRARRRGRGPARCRARLPRGRAPADRADVELLLRAGRRLPRDRAPRRRAAGSPTRSPSVPARRGARSGWRCRPAAPATLPGVELVRDDPPLSARDLDALDGVLTGCALAIAETGTIVLDGGARSGRRALTLVPDYHLCVVGGGPGRGLRAGRRRASSRRRRPAGRPITLRLRPVGHLGHRARACRGRPRPAHARRVRGEQTI